MLRRRADDLPARMADSAAILFTVLLAFLEIRHLDQRRRRLSPRHRPRRARAAGLRRARHDDRARTRARAHRQHRARRRRAADRRPVRSPRSCSGWGSGKIPMLTGDPVGGPFFNLILLGYGLPAVLMAVLARMIRGRPGRSASMWLAAVTAIALALAYLTLEVRTPVPRPGADARLHHRCRAIHLFGGVARLRRRAAARRHRAAVAAGAARVRRGRHAHRRQGVPGTTWPACTASTGRCRSSASAWC